MCFSECCEDDSAVRVLYRRYLQLTQGASSNHELVVTNVLLHEVSEQKLNSACAAAMKTWAHREELQADVMQEARISVLTRCRIGRIAFRGETAQQFGGWLWKLWFNACRHAWRTYRTALVKEPSPGGNLSEGFDSLQRVRNTVHGSRWELVVVAIAGIKKENIRLTMMDWAAGFSGTESAETRGIARATISKRRTQGIDILRKRLAADELDEAN